MAVTFLKRSMIPQAVKGKAGSLSVSISDKGQIGLSTLATKFFEGSPKIVLAFDAGKVFLFRSDAKLVAKAKMAEKDMIELRPSKKGGTASFAASGLLRHVDTFGEHIYDYKASGNQVFPGTEDGVNGCVTFQLPVGAITPKPKVAREPRKKKVVAAGTPANPGSTVAANVPQVQAEELVLETV